MKVEKITKMTEAAEVLDSLGLMKSKTLYVTPDCWGDAHVTTLERFVEFLRDMEEKNHSYSEYVAAADAGVDTPPITFEDWIGLECSQLVEATESDLARLERL